MTLLPPRPTVSQARPAPVGPTGGQGARVAGARWLRTGGRVAGQSYALPAPKGAGKDGGWPFRDYTDVDHAALRETHEWWHDICRDVARCRGRARRMEQADLVYDAEVLAGRAVLQALASHHELQVDLDEVVYAGAGRPSFAPLWRFSSLAAQALGVWVDVRPDVDGAANRAEAERL